MLGRTLSDVISESKIEAFGSATKQTFRRWGHFRFFYQAA